MAHPLAALAETRQEWRRPAALIRPLAAWRDYTPEPSCGVSAAEPAGELPQNEGLSETALTPAKRLKFESNRQREPAGEILSAAKDLAQNLVAAVGLEPTTYGL